MKAMPSHGLINEVVDLIPYMLYITLCERISQILGPIEAVRFLNFSEISDHLFLCLLRKKYISVFAYIMPKYIKSLVFNMFGCACNDF